MTRQDEQSARADAMRVRALAGASVVMLIATFLLRTATPLPLAPRVHVRWAPGISAAQRAETERQFGLAAASRRDEATWEYDLVELRPQSVHALINHPAVADTHYLDRVTGAVAADAPAGSTPLAERRLARWVHSPLFEWFMLFWASSLLVSAAWLASPRTARER